MVLQIAPALGQFVASAMSRASDCDSYNTRNMDWDKEYERSRAGRTDPRARQSSYDGVLINHDELDGRRRDEGRRGEILVNNANDGTVGSLSAEGGQKGTPLEQLTRHWMNERHAPDILPAQENLLAHLLDHLRRQVSLSIPAVICSD